jgi:hypothetical protein
MSALRMSLGEGLLQRTLGTDHKWRQPSQSRGGQGRIGDHGRARLKLAWRLIFAKWRIQCHDFVVPDVVRDFGRAAQPGIDRPFRFGALISEPIAELAGRKFAAAISAKRRQDRGLTHPGDLVDRLAFAAGKDVSHGNRLWAACSQERNASMAVFPNLLHFYLPAPIRWSGNQVAISGKKHRMTIANIIQTT